MKPRLGLPSHLPAIIQSASPRPVPETRPPFCPPPVGPLDFLLFAQLLANYELPYSHPFTPRNHHHHHHPPPSAYRWIRKQASSNRPSAIPWMRFLYASVDSDTPALSLPLALRLTRSTASLVQTPTSTTQSHLHHYHPPYPGRSVACLSKSCASKRSCIYKQAFPRNLNFSSPPNPPTTITTTTPH